MGTLQATICDPHRSGKTILVYLIYQSVYSETTFSKFPGNLVYPHSTRASQSFPSLICGYVGVFFFFAIDQRRSHDRNLGVDKLLVEYLHQREMCNHRRTPYMKSASACGPIRVSKCSIDCNVKPIETKTSK